MKPLVELGQDDPHQPIARFGMRSFDRQWIFVDPRLAKTESPSLWASVSAEQVFLTTMTTTSLGRGQAATVTTAVPDKHHFRGSYGGKDIIPLYRDAMLTPNCDPKALALLNVVYQQADAGASAVTIERLFAYCFGVLAGTDYTDRFHEALETPGPRIPLTADPDLFHRMASHGEKLIWLQTFGERFGSRKSPAAGVKWKTQPTRLPEGAAELDFDPTTETLRVADGVLTGVSDSVWQFEVSGMDVVRKWLGYRMEKPAGRAASSTSPLDQIRPTTWLPEWSTELVEVVTAIKESLAMIPDGIALLEEIVSGPLIDGDELPVAPEALRKPPSVKAGKSGELELYGEDE